MQNPNHSGYTNFDGSPDLAPEAEPHFGRVREQPGMDKMAPEQWMYLASGALLALGGLMRRGPLGLLMSALGGGLLYQGITGVNPLQRLLNLDEDSVVGATQAGSYRVPQQASLDI